MQRRSRKPRKHSKLTASSLAKRIAQDYKKLAHKLRHGDFLPAGVRLVGDHIEVSERYEDWDDSERWHEYILKVWPDGRYELWTYSHEDGSKLIPTAPEGVIEDFKRLVDMVEIL